MQHFNEQLVPLRLGLVCALLTVFYGFTLGGIFGAREDQIMEHLNATAQRVVDTVYTGDATKIEPVLKKSWVYFKRAHLHATGIGTTAVALILLLSTIVGIDLWRRVIALALGVGGLGYSSFWMFAALRAPALGSTDAAKESSAWLALPSAGLCVASVAATLLMVVRVAYLQRGDHD